MKKWDKSGNEECARWKSGPVGTGKNIVLLMNDFTSIGRIGAAMAFVLDGQPALTRNMLCKIILCAFFSSRIKSFWFGPIIL